MSTKQFIGSLGAIMMSVLFTPALEELAKVYVISVVVFITMLINLLFRLNQVREWIVKRIMSDVLNEIYKDKDVRAILTRKFSTKELSNEG